MPRPNSGPSDVTWLLRWNKRTHRFEVPVYKSRIWPWVLAALLAVLFDAFILYEVFK